MKNNTCSYCETICNESELNSNSTYPIGTIRNCITYNLEYNEYHLWNKWEGNYYFGNIMKINYCPKCGRCLKYPLGKDPLERKLQ